MTIYVIDDHPMMREAVVMMLRRQRPSIPVIEVDRMGMLSISIAEHGYPTMFSLDLKLPDTIGVSGIRQLKGIYPIVPLAVVSASPPDEWEDKCLEAGADIYIEKTTGSLEMFEKLKSLLAADSTFEETRAPDKKLSKRQSQLMQLLHKGMSNKQIAEELGINEETVKVHLWRLFRQIEVKNRTQAVVYATQHGLIFS